MRAQHEAGQVLLVGLLFGCVMIAMGLAVIQYVDTEVRTSYRSIDEMRALTTAESGVSYAIAQLSTPPNGDAYTGTGGAWVSFGDGEFNVRVLPDPNGDPEARWVEVVGRVRGKIRQVVASVKKGYYTFPDAAMVVNGNIDFNHYNQGTRSVMNDPPTYTVAPTNANWASIMANGWIYNGTIDGAALSYSGMPLGTNSDLPAGILPEPIPFPTTDETNEWASAWYQQAWNSPRHYTSAALPKTPQPQYDNNGNLLLDKNGNVITAMTDTVQAPCYINGTITDDLVVYGPGVCYIDGQVNLTGGGERLTNHGALIVVTGTAQIGTDSVEFGGNAGYAVTGPPDGTGSFTTDITQTALIAVSGDVILHGCPQMKQSLVYAMNGSIELCGTSDVWGALVAGGTPPAGGGISGNGDIKLNYPQSFMQTLRVLPGGYKLKAWHELPVGQPLPSWASSK
jgi:hypothetical protein